MANNITLTPRPSDTRGHADHGWLKSFHTFSFASYYDPAHSAFGPLRVINEDRVAANEGFGTHSHKEFEIFSYVIAGELAHHDSMKNSETLKRGDVQMTSAGTGIQHSEYNRGAKETHFLQIWAKPNKSGLKPAYYTRHYPDSAKRDVLLRIVAPADAQGVLDAREDDNNGPTPVHADLSAYASILSPGKSVSRSLPSGLRRAYIHLSMSAYRDPGKAPSTEASRLEVAVQGGAKAALQEGDGLYIDLGGEEAELTFTNEGKGDAEFVHFEMTA